MFNDRWIRIGALVGVAWTLGTYVFTAYVVCAASSDPYCGLLFIVLNIPGVVVSMGVGSVITSVIPVTGMIDDVLVIACITLTNAFLFGVFGLVAGAIVRRRK